MGGPQGHGRDLGLTAAAFEFLAEAVLADPVVFGVVFTDAGLPPPNA